MADKFIQNNSVFEITDYTTASDWERFISNIEEVLIEWKLNNHSSKDLFYQDLPAGSISNGIWREERDVVKFGDMHFEMRYLYLDSKSTTDGTKKDSSSHPDEQLDFQDADDELNASSNLSNNEAEPETDCDVQGGLARNLPECLRDFTSTSNDFAPKAHCLVRWYNLRRFILIKPKGDTITTDNRIRMMLSSASIALANVDCHVPIFVQIRNPKSNFYQGISEHNNIRTMYEMVYKNRSMYQYRFLSELISLFREKISCGLDDPIMASVRLNYSLNRFDLFGKITSGSSHEDPDAAAAADDDSHQKQQGQLNMKRPSRPKVMDLKQNASFEEVKEALEGDIPSQAKQILTYLHLASIWPPMSDKVIIDSWVHSDLDPAEAPLWTLRAVSSDSSAMKVVYDTQALNELLSGAVDYAYDELDAATVFDNCDRQQLKASCLRLSYDLAIQPEVEVSRKASDPVRKIIALLFARASELNLPSDSLDELARNVRPSASDKRVSLSEMYRTFDRKHRPSVKEFIVRAQVSRPFHSSLSPALPQRMFATLCDEELRLCGAFSELTT